MTLYVSDLDGTLLTSKDVLSDETTANIKLLIENQVNFTIATGRSLYYSNKYIEELGIKLPVVLSNGVYIYHPVSREYLVKNFLDTNTVNEFLKLCEESKLQAFIYSSDLGNGRSSLSETFLAGNLQYPNIQR